MQQGFSKDVFRRRIALSLPSSMPISAALYLLFKSVPLTWLARRDMISPPIYRVRAHRILLHLNGGLFA